MRHKWSWVLLLCAALFPPLVPALSSDRDAPMSIEADHLEINEAKGYSLYRGHVKVIKGTMVFTADEVMLYTTKAQKVEKIVVVGMPATYRQQQDKSKGEVRAESNRIEYYAQEDRVILQDSAHLWQGENEFLGNRIEYNITAENVKASMAEAGGERVQVIIQPQKAEQANEVPPASSTSQP